jgi:nucleotide-binding universal stress UspA family protein
MDILLAVDGSDFTKRMLAYVAAHDELFRHDSRYTILTVVPQIPAYAASYVDREVVTAYYREQAEEVLAPIRAFAGQAGWKAEFEHRAGNAGDVIAELATTGKCDMVVMGSHGHSALTGMVLGSVATRVLAKCKTPVLLVR